MNTPTGNKLSSLISLLDEPPKVYLAGKIRKHCWRHTLVSGLRNHHWTDGPLNQDDFLFIGPFFVSCDHGCYHKPNKHGNGVGCTPDLDTTKKSVVRLCLKAIDEADLVFCYVDAKDCYGTIAEIGYAHARKKRIVIALAPEVAGIKENEFWFACSFAYKVHINICKCQLTTLFEQTLRELP